MMDYYEEFGVARQASTEEIRKAYRRLVRLLHPDKCKDKETRRLADLQMKRLNAMLETLRNPVERVAYDRTLLPGKPLAPVKRIDPLIPARPVRWVWPSVAAVLGLALLVATVGRSPGSDAALASVPDPAEDWKPQLTKRMPLPLGGSARAPERRLRDATGIRKAPSVGERAPVVSPGIEPEPSEPLPASAKPQAVYRAPPPLQEPPVSTLAGDWFFISIPHGKTVGMYPPEFIEMRVMEGGGIVRGRYRARYRVTDQAVSPNVSFQFEGPGSESSARAPWVGAGGAKGEIAMHLLNSGALEVSWVASRLGDEMGLISGSATLVRKIE